MGAILPNVAKVVVGILGLGFGVCFSTRWKHTSGTVAVHMALPAMHHGGRSFNLASYGCHTTYNNQKTSMQHIRQQCLYSKVHQMYILFLNMLNKAFSYLVWQHWSYLLTIPLQEDVGRPIFLVWDLQPPTIKNKGSLTLYNFSTEKIIWLKL